ncbi:hypothetical protein, partial [Pyrococcus kukulkanii]|uniref:hypothetical protein n=1 Tax=Pyrococcus kukulkanii TaxID=1609559 RepID=UPI0035644C6E
GEVVSDDELKLIALAGRKKLSEPANLTITSVSYDGSKFDITVNVTLPSGAQYIYLPRDAVVDATTIQNWSTGHKLIDVSGKNWITVTLPAALGSSPAGVNKLVVETDEGLYLYGSGTYTLTNPSPRLFQATNYISSGKVTQVGFSEPALTKRDPLPITLGGGSGTITVDQFSLEHVKLNVQSVASPITLQPSLLPLTKYTVAKDMNKVGEYESNTGGEFTFTIDATGLWEIFKSELGLSLAGDYIIKVIITTILVGIFAMIVVEATPVKFDDQATRAMLTLIAIVILAALVKLLVFAR